MGVYKEDEIAALSLERGIVCQKCATREDWNNATEDEIISQDDVEKGDEIYFCDDCKKRL